MRRQPEATSGEPVDFDVGGMVRVRVVGTAADVAVVRRQLGPLDTAPNGRADITIRFVDHLARPDAQRILGIGEVAYSEAGVLLTTRQTNGRFVRIPFAEVGGPCELTCERGIEAVPLLIALVNLAALTGGVLPLHASAVTYRGTGVLITGWSKGGKTETLLSFMREGADYVGDEWVYVTPDRMVGVPEPMRLWSWQLEQLAEHAAVLSPAQRYRLRALAAAARAATLAARLPGSAGSAAQRVSAVLERQRNVRVPPHRLFGAPRCVLEGKPDKVVLVASHTSPRVTIAPVDPLDIAERMRFSLAEERAVLDAAYRHHRFAFPNAASPSIEDAPRREAELLRAALAGKEAYLLLHPYPPSIASLFHVLREVL